MSADPAKVVAGAGVSCANVKVVVSINAKISPAFFMFDLVLISNLVWLLF